MTLALHLLGPLLTQLLANHCEVVQCSEQLQTLDRHKATLVISLFDGWNDFFLKARGGNKR